MTKFGSNMRKNDHTQPYRIPGAIEEHGSAPSIPNENGNTLESLWYWCDRMLDYHPVSMLYYDIAVLLCLHREGLIINGDFCPNPSKEHCNIYAKAWETTGYGRGDFMLKCGHQAWKNLITYIQEMKVTKATCLKAIDRYVGSTSNLGEEIYVQPQELTELGLGLLGYKQGTVYNPFAGAASYGLAMSVGELYYGEEIEPRTWVIGTLRMILKNCHSSNYVLGDSTKGFLGDSATAPCKQKFDNVITTPPFGLKLGVENMVTEEFLLYRAEHILTEKGKMVLFVHASFVNKSGKYEKIRERVIKNNMLDTVIALPKETFLPYSSVNTLAIVLKKGRTESTVKFLDARDCTNKNSLDTAKILCRMNDKNHILIVQPEQIRDNKYSWHPAKYEESFIGHLEPGFERIQLRKILAQTGTTAKDSGELACISLSELSSNPFEFVKDYNTLPKLFINEFDNKTEILIKEYSAQLNELDKRFNEIEVQIADADDHLAYERKRIDEIIHANQKRKQAIDAEAAHLTADINEITSELAVRNRSLKEALSSPNQGINPDLVKSVEKRIEELEAKRKDCTQELIRLHEAAEIETAKDIKESEAKIAQINKELESLGAERHSLSHARMKLASSLNSLVEQASGDDNRNGSQTRLVKVVRPALFVGGSKPNLKFIFVDASIERPVYIKSSHCFAFKVDTSIVNLDYLVYQLSQLTFKDFGETIPMISANEIISSSIDVCPLDKQAEFISKKEDQAFPYKAEIRALKTEIKGRNEVMASKHHELGHYRYRLFNCSSLLYDFISNLPDSTPGLDETMRILDVVNENLIDMQDAIDTLEETQLFPAGTPLNIYEYFENYCCEHTGGSNYRLEFQADKLLMSEECIVKINGGALHTIINHIRTNAEKHGFADDPDRTDYHIIISLKMIQEEDICVIDFINNGAPFAAGVDESVYADPSGVAEPHPGTGIGGAEVALATKTYHGSFAINPKDADPDQTTIRIVFPLYHE